jgi:hypothetical protein
MWGRSAIGGSGKHLLVLSFTGYDPLRTKAEFKFRSAASRLT